MSISGRILKKIVGALTEAFPTREKLVMMLEFELSIAESYVPVASDYQIVVYQLVKKLDSEGKIIDLIEGACRDNGNQNLQVVKQKIVPIIKLYQILASLEKDFIEQIKIAYKACCPEDWHLDEESSFPNNVQQVLDNLEDMPLGTNNYSKIALFIVYLLANTDSKLPVAELNKLKKWQQGLYSYDAIGTLQDAKGSGQDNLGEIGKYIKLGALGTALLPSQKPRVLLIDEIDKSDIDLPNDLLNIFEEGQYEIQELGRIADLFSEITVQTSDKLTTKITQGKVQCQAFPFIILTSNGEREFPPAFLRRCLRLDLREPTPQELAVIVKAHLGSDIIEKAQPIIEKFIQRRNQGDLATDQLLNAIYMLTTTDNTSDSPMVDSHNQDNQKDERKAQLIERLLQYLNATGGI